VGHSFYTLCRSKSNLADTDFVGNIVILPSNSIIFGGDKNVKEIMASLSYAQADIGAEVRLSLG
jgi:hypothetical protein